MLTADTARNLSTTQTTNRDRENKALDEIHFERDLKRAEESIYGAAKDGKTEAGIHRITPHKGPYYGLDTRRNLLVEKALEARGFKIGFGTRPVEGEGLVEFVICSW